MIVITSDTELRKYVPNVFRSAAGEMSFFEKIKPHIDAAEQWLASVITGDRLLEKISNEEENSPKRINATTIVVSEAMRLAIPSLDLVLTSNGYGIVSNQTVAPASKERVERLIRSITDARDRAICGLLELLRLDIDWQQSDCCDWFATTFVNNPISLLQLKQPGESLWLRFLAERPKIQHTESRISRLFLGDEYLFFLRQCSVGKATPNEEDLHIMRQLESIVVGSLSGELQKSSLVAMVNVIRQNPEAFPIWHGSPISYFYKAESFKNKKENHGYFF